MAPCLAAREGPDFKLTRRYAVSFTPDPDAPVHTDPEAEFAAVSHQLADHILRERQEDEIIEDVRHWLFVCYLGRGYRGPTPRY